MNSECGIETAEYEAKREERLDKIYTFLGNQVGQPGRQEINWDEFLWFAELAYRCCCHVRPAQGLESSGIEEILQSRGVSEDIINITSSVIGLMNCLINGPGLFGTSFDKMLEGGWYDVTGDRYGHLVRLTPRSPSAPNATYPGNGYESDESDDKGPKPKVLDYLTGFVVERATDGFKFDALLDLAELVYRSYQYTSGWAQKQVMSQCTRDTRIREWWQIWERVIGKVPLEAERFHAELEARGVDEHAIRLSTSILELINRCWRYPHSVPGDGLTFDEWLSKYNSQEKQLFEDWLDETPAESYERYRQYGEFIQLIPPPAESI